MDRLEAISTIFALWPTSFKPQDQWRRAVMDELDKWSDDEVSGNLDRLKVAHSGKKINIDTLRNIKKKQTRGNDKAYNKALLQFLSDNSLTEAYKEAEIGDKVMITRMFAFLFLEPTWQYEMLRLAGSVTLFKPYERIKNLSDAAEQLLIVGEYGKLRKACYADNRYQWNDPVAPVELILPPDPVKINKEDSRAGLRRISEIANLYGGLKMGNYSRIYESPEYQEYLREFTARTGMQPG